MDMGFSPDDEPSVLVRISLVKGLISIEEAVDAVGLDEVLRILGMR